MTEKRLAVVTGAARGIGRAIVFELLKQGRIVAGLDMMEDQLKDLERVVKEAGFEVVTRCVDITQTEKFTEVLESLASEYGGIGILVNNAGITKDNLLMRMTDEEFDKVIAVNLRAAFVAIRAAYKSMLRNKFGRIINISSVSGVMGNAGQANYSASKAGLIGSGQDDGPRTGQEECDGQLRRPRLHRHADGPQAAPARDRRGCRAHPHETHGHRRGCGQGGRFLCQ